MLVRRIRILAEIVLCSLLLLLFVFYVATHANRTLLDSACKLDTDVVSVLLSWSQTLLLHCLSRTPELLNLSGCEAQLTRAFISVNMVVDTSALICRSPGLFPKVLTSDEWGGESKEEKQRFLVDRWNREERKRERGSWVSEALMVWNGSLKYICAPVLYNWKRCTSAASPFSCMWQN